jgi:hypothetical protein
MYKIIVLQQHYFPEMAGVARRAKELSEQFIKSGHSVTVYTTFPRDFRSMPGFNAKRKEVLNGVKIIRSKSIFNVGKNTIFRMLSYFFYVINCILHITVNRNKYDMILSMAPLPPAIAGAFANKFYGKYHHFDVPDILPDLGISAGMIKNKTLIKILYLIEKWVYKNSNSISAVTHGQINNIINKGVDSSKLSYIPDWINVDFFNKNLKKYKADIINKHKYNDKFIISFVGNVGALQNPEIFLHIMKGLKESGYNNLHFLYIGDGILLDRLKKQVKQLKISNVEFIGRIERKYVPSYMNISNVLVANYLPNDYLDICIPGKLFEYAISNKPIIMGSKGEAKNLIKKYNLGVSVEPSSIDEFKEAIINFSNNEYIHTPDLKSFLSFFSLDNISQKYENILSQIKNSR